MLVVVAVPVTLLFAAGVVLMLQGPPDEIRDVLRPIELTEDEEGEDEEGFSALYVTRRGTKEEDFRDGRLLVVLHGCGRSAEDWFVLPEEQAIVRTALAGPFVAVLAVDSRDVLWHCWRPAVRADTAAVHGAIAALRRTLCRRATPAPPCLRGGTVVLGASSGGTMATALLHPRAGVAPLAGVVALVSPGDAPTLAAVATAAAAAADAGPGEAALPRVAFVHMAGDTVYATADAVAAHVAALNAAQRGTARAFVCTGVRVDRAFFARRVPGVTPAASAVLWAVLVDAGLVDAPHARATVPPAWDAAAHVPRLVARCAARLRAFPWAQHAAAIAEELRVLQNVHEATREHVAEALAWTLRLE